MSKPHCVMYVRPDRTAMICSWCQRDAMDKNIHDIYFKPGDSWAETNGYDVSHGICESHSQAEIAKLKRK